MMPLIALAGRLMWHSSELHREHLTSLNCVGGPLKRDTLLLLYCDRAAHCQEGSRDSMARQHAAPPESDLRPDSLKMSVAARL
jgi:hypothetical protein